MKRLCFIFLALFVVSGHANDNAIYANGDGTFTYYGETYTVDNFPIDKLVVFENTVQVFPVEGLSPDESFNAVKPLARKFIGRGYKVETRMLGQVVPYIIKKPGT